MQIVSNRDNMLAMSDPAFYFFLQNRIWHFMQIISNGDNLHEISDPVFWEK